MKFFKHFTDSHRGKSMQMLRKRFGLSGVGRYWLFVELCAEKLHKSKDEEYTEAHCHFEFEKCYLSRSLGFANLKQCSRYLEAIAELGLSSVQDNGEVYSCSMPKLLECMDRDTKRARVERVPSAPKRKRKNKEKEREIESGAALFHPLIEIWNDRSGSLPKVLKSNKARDQKAENRWPENEPEEWAEIITRISKSSFCNGKSERGWVATFDWLLQSETHLKVSEGKYDNRADDSTDSDLDLGGIFRKQEVSNG